MMHIFPSFRSPGDSGWTKIAMLIRPVITLHIVLHTQPSDDIILLKCQLSCPCDKQHGSLNGESVDAM